MVEGHCLGSKRFVLKSREFIQFRFQTLQCSLKQLPFQRQNIINSIIFVFERLTFVKYIITKETEEKKKLADMYSMNTLTRHTEQKHSL